MQRGLIIRRDCRWIKSLGVMLVLALSTGCGKVPTWGELTGQQPAAPPTTTPVAVQPVPSQTPSTPVLPPKPKAAEVIAKFKALRPAEISDSSLAELGGLTEGFEDLTEIDASNSQVTNAGLAYLRNLPTLKQLELGSTKVDDAGMQHLAQIPSLESLTLNQTLVSDEGVSKLTALPNLKKLELMGCHLTQAGFAAIGKLPALEHIVLNRTLGVNDAAVDLICEAVTLRKLEFNSCNEITDQGLLSLRKLEVIDDLQISRCNVTGVGLGGAVKQQGLKTLKVLHIYGTPITEDGAKAINSIKSLELLAVGELPINDRGLVMLTQGLKNLKHLHVANCKGVTGSGLTAIKAADDLEILSLHGTGLVDQGLVLLKGHKKLKSLDLTNTSCSLAAVQSLKKSLPNCEILYAGQKY